MKTTKKRFHSAALYIVMLMCAVPMLAMAAIDDPLPGEIGSVW